MLLPSQMHNVVCNLNSRKYVTVAICIMSYLQCSNMTTNCSGKIDVAVATSI